MKHNREAFEVIITTFICTFHYELNQNDLQGLSGTVEPYSRTRYIKLKRQLKLLGGMRNERQLIMFLTGAGGSGKMEVINLVLAYAKGFCKEMEYVFDKCMIVVTAMSGVAAMIVKGETVHSAAKLNCSKITLDHQREWAGAQMIIVDEISFASSKDIMNLHETLGQLKQVIQE